MAKTNKPAAAPPTNAAVAPVERKTTDKTYESLQPHEEVVVKVGPRVRSQNNKVIVVEEARDVIFTKAGFESMDRDEDGETLHTPTKVLGIPSYQTVEDFTVSGGSRKDMVTLYFEESADESDDADAPQA